MPLESRKKEIDKNKTSNNLKVVIALIIITIGVAYFTLAGGVSACDCARLGDKVGAYDGGLWMLNVSPSEKKVLSDCRDKYDGLINAKRICND